MEAGDLFVYMVGEVMSLECVDIVEILSAASSSTDADILLTFLPHIASSEPELGVHSCRRLCVPNQNLGVLARSPIPPSIVLSLDVGYVLKQRPATYECRD